MASKIKQLAPITDFVPRSISIVPTVNPDDQSTSWLFRMRGDEVDAQGNIVNADVLAAFDVALLNKWAAFFLQALKVAKVQRGLDDGA